LIITSEEEELVVITGLKAEQRQVEAIYVKKKSRDRKPALHKSLKRDAVFKPH
jgi:hypothetical protein